MVWILKGLLEGLAELHSVGIVHGDIKPANILLSRHHPPLVRLADFGSSAISCFSGNTTMHRTSHIHGTAPYKAPEMFRFTGDSVNSYFSASRKGDMYSAAIVCHESLSQSRPFDDRAQRLTAIQGHSIMTQTYNVLREYRFDVFFSHPWAQKSFLSSIYYFLTRFGYRVWFDQQNMPHNLTQGMIGGIAASDVVVVCVGPLYQTSNNCMLELRAAVASGKPVVTVLTERLTTGWASEEITRLCQFTSMMYVDASAAAALNWECDDGPTDEMLDMARSLSTRLVEILQLPDVHCSPSLEAFLRLESSVSAVREITAREAAAREAAERERQAAAERDRVTFTMIYLHMSQFN
jgi:serine/threonine protein kinase